MEITGNVILVGGIGVGTIFTIIILKQLFGIKLPIRIKNMLSLERKLSSEEGEISEELKKYDLILLGEVHSYDLINNLPGLSREIKEKYKNLFEKELDFIEKNKPDYLFLEGTDLRYKDSGKLKFIEEAKKLGTKVFPIESKELEEKFFPLRKTYSRIKAMNILLDYYIKTKDEKYLSSAEELLNSDAPGVPHLELQEIVQLKRISPGNLNEVYENLRKADYFITKVFKEKLPEINKLREEHMAYVINKIHKIKPDAQMMLIVGQDHVEEDSTLLKELEAHEIKYKREIVGEEISEEMKKDIEK